MKTVSTLLIALLALVEVNAQLINPDFEEWTTTNMTDGMSNYPLGWDLYVGQMQNTNMYFYYPPCTESQNNDYALKMSIWYAYTKDMAVQRTTIDYRPQKLTGYYTYTDNHIENIHGPILDTALVEVYLTKVDEVTSVIDTVGAGTLALNAADEYTFFEVNIEYASVEMPTHITVALDPSLVKREPGVEFFAVDSMLASFFIVDNLHLEGEVTLSTEVEQTPQLFTVYPSPTKDKVTIQLKEKQEVEVYTLSGTLIHRFMADTICTLDVSDWADGIYFVRCNYGTQRIMKL
jgi:hypothetical protein